MALAPRMFAWLVLACALMPAAGFAQARQPAKPAEAAQSTANAVPSQQAVALVNEGDGLLNRKDYAGAEAAYQKALQTDPSFAAAHRGLGITLWREGVLARAWQELNTVARLEPDKARAHYELGMLAWHIYSGDSARIAAMTGLSAEDFRSLALSEIQKAASLGPHDFNMRLQLANIELEADKTKEGQADALGALSLASSAAERARAQVALAQAYSATGDQMRAQTEFQKAIAEDPSSGAAYLGLGQISLSQQDPAKAQKYFYQAIQVSPDLGAAYAALGRMYAQADQRAEALAMLQKAVTFDPGDWHSEFELGKLLMDSGEAARAKDIFTKIVAAQPDFLPAGEQLALIKLRQGDVQGAIAAAQSLAMRNPQAAEGHRVLALAYWRQRQADASLGECAQALAADPHSISMQALQAFVLWQTKRHGEARRVLRDAAHQDPSILSPVTFCRQIVCGSGDVFLVGTFLRDNRWVLATPADQ
ncbi:MAG: tetratricopeptide repeat protein [Acidobacteria bacterium]|nr:tetratricopeptide repeat protein [Acidobacteriota bacterium]